MRRCKYQSLSEVLRERIESGIYAVGGMLPSESELMKEFQYSRQTVRQAVSLLEDEGFVETQQGRGSIVKQKGAGLRSNTVGLLVPIIEDYIFPDILRTISRELNAEKYLCFVSSTELRYDNERMLLKEYLEKNVDALLVLGIKDLYPNPNIDMYEEFHKRGKPLVFMTAPYQAMPYAVSFTPDDYGGAKRVTQLLLKKGYRKIYSIFNGLTVSGSERYRGYLAALQEAGCPPGDRSTCWYLGDTPTQNEIIKEFVRAADCTAFVCYNDKMAGLVTEILKSQGKRVPDDVAVTGFDDSSFCGANGIRITSVHIEGYAEMAAKAVVRLIGGESVDSSVLQTRVVEKEST